MGQTISKLTDKYLHPADKSLDNSMESRGIMHDLTTDSEFDVKTVEDDDSLPDTKQHDLSVKTPPNIFKLKNDPRSPSNFDRTPLKTPLDE